MNRIVRLFARLLGFYLRHTGHHRGRWRLETLAVKWSPVFRGYLRPTVITTAHGFRMVVDGDSQAGRILYATGRYEPAIAALVERLAGPGDLVIDGGAHIGFFSLLASQRVGATGRVLAFEPSRATAQVLQANIELNRCSNITISPQALSDKPGTAVIFQASATETGQTTLRPIVEPQSEALVDLVALDDVLEDERRPAVLIKLDLEGAELRALRGMARVLSAGRPHLIVEVTDGFLRQSGGSAADLYRYLAGFGYTAYVIEWDTLQRVGSEDVFTGIADQFNALFTCAPPGGFDGGPTARLGPDEGVAAGGGRR